MTKNFFVWINANFLEIFLVNLHDCSRAWSKGNIQPKFKSSSETHNFLYMWSLIVEIPEKHEYKFRYFLKISKDRGVIRGARIIK